MPHDRDSSRDEPAIVVDTRALIVRRPVDDAARAKYLDVLRQTGSRAAAAAAARPHIHSKRSAMATMESHIATNPEFAAQVIDAETGLLGIVEATIVDRALHGVTVFEKSAPNPRTGELEVVERRTEHDNTLLVKVARQLGRKGADPNAWADEKRLVVSGGTTNVTATVDIDRMLENMDEGAIRQMIAGANKARELSAAADGDGGGDWIEAEATEVPKRSDDQNGN